MSPSDGEVVIRYETPRLRIGAAISGVALIITLWAATPIRLFRPRAESTRASVPMKTRSLR
jgi:hypothetical protein